MCLVGRNRGLVFVLGVLVLEWVVYLVVGFMMFWVCAMFDYICLNTDANA